METEIIKIDQKYINMRLIDKAVKLLKDGDIVSFPTETVYGLGANGLNSDAVKKIYKAKGRPSDNPLILHISNKNQLKTLVREIPEVAEILIKRFWPGPLTIIFKKGRIVPDIITGGLDTVAVRMPNHPIALELITQSEFPIAAPSANTSGKPSPTKANHVIQDMMGKIPLIIDGGSTEVGLESTVLDLSTNIPRILRPGGVTLEELRDIIPSIVQDENIINIDVQPKSPGQKYKHYAPEAEMLLFTGDIDRIVEKINLQAEESILQGKRIGIIATEETKDRYNKGVVLVSGSRNKPNTVASNIFTVIREIDKMNIDLILAEGIDIDNIGMAIMNRLTKAADGKIVHV
ncbi:MAG TPA: L-threonylcarbamoyladenylate synthase [Tissierellaceae bacterium]|nr:L-threonylcarbamoyladenylate synthase [Tissierellaceae bacterium]